MSRVVACPDCGQDTWQHSRRGVLWNTDPSKGYFHLQSCPARKTPPTPPEEKK